jgi:hypothetical protein
MIASQSCKSARRARHLSTGHGRPRSDFQIASQIVRQLTTFQATYRSFRKRFTLGRLAEAFQSQSHALLAALKSP